MGNKGAGSRNSELGKEIGADQSSKKELAAIRQSRLDKDQGGAEGQRDLDCGE
jgi:hypothetical protein